MKLSYLNIIIIFTLATNTVPIIGGEKEKILTTTPQTPKIFRVELFLTPQSEKCRKLNASWDQSDKHKCNILDIEWETNDNTYIVQNAVIKNDNNKNTNWLSYHPKEMPLSRIDGPFTQEYYKKSVFFPTSLPDGFVKQLLQHEKIYHTTDKLESPIAIIFELKNKEQLLKNSTTNIKKYFFYGATALGVIFMIWLTNMHKNIATFLH